MHAALVSTALDGTVVGHVCRDSTAIEARERPAPKPKPGPGAEASGSQGTGGIRCRLNGKTTASSLKFGEH